MKRSVLFLFTVVVFAQNVAMAQDTLNPTAEGVPQVLCLVDGSDVVVTVPAEQCPDGRKAPTASEQTIVDDTKKSKPSRFQRILDKNDLNANVKLLDLDLVEGVSFGAKYKYQVERSELQPNYFMRVDRYILGANVNPGAWVDGLTPLSVGLGHETEIMFARHFETGQEARKLKNGILPKSLPVNSAKALALTPGTYVRFNARMNAMIGIGQTLGDVPLLDASIGANYVISGDFQIHMFRLDNSRVRLKLVALRGNEKSVGAKLGLKPEIFGVRLLDKQFVRVAKLDKWFEAKIAGSKTDLFMVDYVMNLADPRANEVYNGMFSMAKGLNSFKISNPSTDKDKLAQRLLSNIAPLEDLALDKVELAKKDPMERAVNRLFKGSNTAHTLATSFRLGVQVVKLKRTETYRSNFLSRVVVDPVTQAPVFNTTTGEEKLEHFLIPTWSLDKQTGGLIFKKWWGEEEMFRSANALFTADANGTPLDFKNISFSRKVSDTIVSESEYGNAKAHLMGLLSNNGKSELMRQIENTPWATATSVRDAQLHLEYFFHAKALGVLEAAGWANKPALINELFKYIISQDIEYTNRFAEIETLIALANNATNPKDKESYVSRARQKQASLQADINAEKGADIVEVADKLALVLSSNTALSDQNPALKRVEILTQLRNSPYFKQAGPGFIVHLLKVSNADVDEVMYTSLKLYGRNLPEVAISFGQNKDRDLYDVVEFVQAIMDGRDTDMRLIGPKNSQTTRVDYAELMKRINVATN